LTATYGIQIQGRVQGVGFRPFVFRLATQQKLTGTVSNNKDGVIIYVNADQNAVETFREALQTQAPPQSIIKNISVFKSSPSDFSRFSIETTKAEGLLSTPITPDFAICTSCKEELHDPGNRRYNYPFTTCVNCGPRYAITKRFPFERDHTSLEPFEMCHNCKTEFKSPSDWRFHSQTNSCTHCGIKLVGKASLEKFINSDQNTILKEAAKRLLTGEIIALKNTNGYLLCCDATNDKAIWTLRKRKQRPNKPFAVVFPDIETIKDAFHLSQEEETTLTNEVSPIVILKNQEDTGIVVAAIAPGLDHTGVMLPHTALLQVFLKHIRKPIVATSGNIHKLPIISEPSIAEEELNSVADFFVHHNLEINFPQDDSVVKFASKQEIILRRSRGLAPSNITATPVTHNILATGADIKSAFAITTQKQLYVSQYFGNLESFEVVQRFQATMAKFFKIFSFKPDAILVDQHPQYFSTQIGKDMASMQGLAVHPIQHHKAHFASILGEHHLFESKEKILGVIWDGTGWGEDDCIWGGEFFSYHNYNIQRLTHFEYYNWIANDKMAKEPRLTLLSLLEAEERDRIRSKFKDSEWQVYIKLLQTNTLQTSSAGRLFDAVASALNLADLNYYESQAAMLLERCASAYTGTAPCNFLEAKSCKKLPASFLVNEIFKKFKEGYDKSFLAYSFMYTLVKFIEKIAKDQDIKTIACSGGVFQNSILVTELLKSPFDVKFHKQLSPNDENIAHGQLQYFQYILNKK
jgi:hydrogenase maturation protein HypF